MSADDDKRPLTATVPLTRRSRARFRRAYAVDRIFELMVGVSAAVGGLLYLFIPERFNDALVYQQISDNFGAIFAWGWDVAYGLGGVLLAIGIGLLDERVKAAGLALLCSTFAINFVAIAADWDKLGHATTLQAGLAVACGVRFHRLVLKGGAE